MELWDEGVLPLICSLDSGEKPMLILLLLEYIPDLGLATTANQD
jgi:hypothetical protein